MSFKAVIRLGSDPCQRDFFRIKPLKHSLEGIDFLKVL
jgi:hypothetical protein